MGIFRQQYSIVNLDYSCQTEKTNMEIIILLFLILLNAFIVMCEMALVSSKKSRIETFANRGDRKAQNVLLLKENPDLFLSLTTATVPAIPGW